MPFGEPTDGLDDSELTPAAPQADEGESGAEGETQGIEPQQPTAPSAPPKRTQDDYDQLVQSLATTESAPLKASMAAGQATTPDRAADVQRLSARTGIPTDVIDRDYDAVLKRARFVSTPYNEMLRDSPKTSEWVAQSPANAAVAADDMDKLGVFEWLLTAPSRFVQQAINEQNYAALRTKQLFGTLSQQEQDQMATEKYMSTLGGKLGSGDSWFRQGIGGAAKLFTFVGTSSLYGVAGMIGGAAVGGAAGTVVEPGAGTVAGAMAGGRAGFQLGQAFGLGKTAFEGAAAPAFDEFSEMKDELGRPINPDVARTAALAVGFVNGAMMGLTGETALKAVGLGGSKAKLTQAAVTKALQNPSIRASLLEASKAYGAHLTEGTALTLAQTAVQIIAGKTAQAAGTQNAPGMTAPGNIDLYAQPTVRNADGSVSTVDSISANFNGKEVLIPRVTPDGRHLTSDQAIAEYKATGRNLGTFDSPESADKFAQQVHEDYAAGKYAARPNAWNTLLNSAEQGALTFATAGATGFGRQLVGDAMRAQRAQQTPFYLDALGETAKDSKLQKRMPEKLQQFVDHVTKDGPTEHVYAPFDLWNTYWQSREIDPAEVTARVTGSSTAYEDARSTGQVEIPTSRYVTQLAATDHNAFWRNELRLEPDGYSFHESEDFKDRLRKLGESSVSEDAKPNPVREAIFQQLTSAGTPSATAERMADLFVNVTGSEGAFSDAGLAGRAGLNAEELFKRYGLRVNRPDLEAPDTGMTANQVQKEPGIPGVEDLGLPTQPVGEGDKLTNETAGGLPFSGEERRTEGAAGENQGRRSSDQAQPDIIDNNDIVGTARRMLLEDNQLEAKANALRDSLGGNVRLKNVLEDKEKALGRPLTDEEVAAAGREVDNKNGPTEDQGATDELPAEPTESRGASRARRDAGDGIAPSHPRVRETRSAAGKTRITHETPAQRAEREQAHYSEVFRDLLHYARESDPTVDPAALRKEFDFRLEAWKALNEDYLSSGRDPKDLLRAIAKYGGLGPESQGGLRGELADLSSGQKFGSVHGVQKVFRSKQILDDRGAPKTGLGFDVMLQHLQQDGAFPWLENTNMLIDALDEIIRNPPAEDTFPGTAELRADVGLDPRKNWWENPWRPVDLATGDGMTETDVQAGEDGDTSFDVRQFYQSLFDDLEEPDPTSVSLAKPAVGPVEDINEHGEAQGRLPGAEDVRDQDVQTPEFEAPFSLTSETAKPTKGKQTTLFQTVEPKGFDLVSPHLTDEERAVLRSDHAARLIDIFKKLPPDTDFAAAAKAGQAKRGWYERAAGALRDVFGEVDAPRFAALLASTSPQVDVETNLRNTASIWTKWNDAGRPTGAKAIEKIIRASVPGEPLPAWIKNATQGALG